jgi:lipopolysaccharide export system protein LptA
VIRLLAAVLAVLAVTPALAAPIKVAADTFVVEEEGKSATFTGNVVVTSEGFELTAGKVLVRYGEGGVSDIRSFDAMESVRIKTEGQTATGSRAVYDPNTQLLTMTGNVQVTNESGTVNGPELTVDMRTNVSTFKGGRVTGTFNPQ